MGDRTWVRLEIKRRDLPHFQKAFGDEYYPDRPFYDYDESAPIANYMTVQMDEVNYGGWDDLEKISQDGVIFIGCHGSGGEYDETAFASFGGVLADVADRDAGPMVPFNMETGQPTELGLEAVREYLGIYNQARAYLDKLDSATAWARGAWT